MQEPDEFRDRIFNTAVDRIEYVTAPIVHVDVRTGRGVNHRSGILLSVGDLRFLVTAAHDLIELHKGGNVPNIVMPEKGRLTVPIGTPEWFTTKDPREDLAVAKLDEATVAALEGHYRYLRISDLRSRNRAAMGRYLLVGFPYQMIQFDEDGRKRCDSWKYITLPFSDTGLVEDFDPNIHVVLKYERKTHNRENETVHPPSMSGCGIWFIEKDRHEVLTPEDFSLVGIQNAWHKGHEYVKGTWIDIVLIIIWKYFSDARDVMRLHGFEWGGSLTSWKRLTDGR